MNIIAAMTYDRVIGKEGALPWNIPEDLKLFKQMTLNNVVIMGRKTFQSIGKPLPKRDNIVISRSLPSADFGIRVCRSLEEAVETARPFKKEVYVIGGSEIYKEALPLAENLYISWVKENYSGDTYFPRFDHLPFAPVDQKTFDSFKWVHYKKR